MKREHFHMKRLEAFWVPQRKWNESKINMKRFVSDKHFTFIYFACKLFMLLLLLLVRETFILFLSPLSFTFGDIILTIVTYYIIDLKNFCLVVVNFFGGDNYTMMNRLHITMMMMILNEWNIRAEPFQCRWSWLET